MRKQRELDDILSEMVERNQDFEGTIEAIAFGKEPQDIEVREQRRSGWFELAQRICYGKVLRP